MHTMTRRGLLFSLIFASQNMDASGAYMGTVDGEIYVCGMLRSTYVGWSAQIQAVIPFRCWKRGDLLSKRRSRKISKWRDWKEKQMTDNRHKGFYVENTRKAKSL